MNIRMLLEAADLSTLENLKKAIARGQVAGIKSTFLTDAQLEKVITSLKDVPEKYRNASIVLALNKMVSYSGVSRIKINPKAYELYFQHKNNKTLEEPLEDFKDGGITDDAFIKIVEAGTKKVDEKQTTKLFENNEWLVVNPKTFAASCKYGANTKWCTTGSKQQFEHYSDRSTGLLIIINKKTKEKFQIDSYSNKLINSLDATPVNEIEIYENLPLQIKEIMKQYKINIWKKILLTSIARGNLELIKKSLDKKDVDIHDRDDEVLRFASSMDNAQVIKILLDKGANVHALNDEPLRNAVSRKNIEVVKLLIDRGADVHAKGDYALRSAIYAFNIDMIKLLIKNGADVHVDNDIALQVASANNSVDLIKFLIKNGADVHAKNNEALGLAKRNGHAEAIDLLKQYMKKEK